MAIPVRPTPIGKPPEVPEAATQVPTRMFRAVKYPIHHPYQNVIVPTAHGVYLALDNWVEVQVAAKVIEPC